MKNIFLFILIAVFTNCYSQTFEGKSYDIKKYNSEKEKILNLIFTTQEFDSIYHSQKIVFVETDLLSKNNSLNLVRGKCKVLIKTKDELKPNEEYVSLADFTCDPNNMIRVRVQIENTLKHLLLNLRLEKKAGTWFVDNHEIFQD